MQNRGWDQIDDTKGEGAVPGHLDRPEVLDGLLQSGLVLHVIAEAGVVARLDGFGSPVREDDGYRRRQIAVQRTNNGRIGEGFKLRLGEGVC